MSRLGKVALLVLLPGFVIVGLVGLGVALADLMMLWATIGGLIATDWWRWVGVALATLPAWVAYRLALNRRRKRDLLPAIRTRSPHA
jgi:hypothetical protein